VAAVATPMPATPAMIAAKSLVRICCFIAILLLCIEMAWISTSHACYCTGRAKADIPYFSIGWDKFWNAGRILFVAYRRHKWRSNQQAIVRKAPFLSCIGDRGRLPRLL
jgi:hypothetical protein